MDCNKAHEDVGAQLAVPFFASLEQQFQAYLHREVCERLFDQQLALLTDLYEVMDPGDRLFLQSCVTPQLIEEIRPRYQVVVDPHDPDDPDAHAVCVARTSNRKQCTRCCQPGSEYCGNHQKSLPYGRIDEPPTQQVVDAECIDFSQYVGVETVEINGREYFYHEGSGLIIHRDTLIIAGRHAGKGIEWYQ